MPRPPGPEAGGASELSPLLRAIGTLDHARAAQLLEKTPALATLRLEIGATREDPKTHFYEAIAHYAYAGDTALHLAAAAHDRGLAERLLHHGAKVDARNRRGAQPLHYACDGAPGSKTSDPRAQASVIELLLGAEADPDSLDKSGVAPLHRAVRTRSFGAVQALLLGGASVSLPNASGSSPLHLAVQDTGRSGSGSEAARNAQVEVIRLLLEHGAKPSQQNAAGKTVLDCVKAEWIRELLSGP